MMQKYPMAMVTRPGLIEFQERTLPEIGAHDVLIQVKACAICGSDLHIFKGKHPSAPLPVAVGHELAGLVQQIGPEVTKIKVGDRITAEPVIACGTCDFCRRGSYHLCANISFQYRKGQGAFSPQFIAPEERVFILPDGLSFEEGALIEPLSVALHAVQKSNIRLGQTAAVFGAGAIGLLVTILLRRAMSGKIFVVDVHDFRLEKALVLGATQVINNRSENALEVILAQTGRLGVHTAFEAAGIEQTLVQALQGVRKGGLVTLLGIFEEQHAKLPVNLFIQKEITLSGSQGYNWDFQSALQLLEQRSIDLKPLITHRVPLNELQKGFEILLDPANKAVKVIAVME